MEWITEVQEDSEGNSVIVFPSELITELLWMEGDVVKWIDNHDGSWTLRNMTMLGEIE